MKQKIEESSAFKVNGFIILAAIATIGLASVWFIATHVAIGTLITQGACEILIAR
jgi:hypothetical protein